MITDTMFVRVFIQVHACMCVCLTVCLSVYTCVHMYTCTYVHVGTRCLLNHTPPCSWSQDLLLSLEIAISVQWPTYELQGLFCLHLPNTGIVDVYARISHGCWGCKLAFTAGTLQTEPSPSPYYATI